MAVGSYILFLNLLWQEAHSPTFNIFFPHLHEWSNILVCMWHDSNLNVITSLCMSPQTSQDEWVKTKPKLDAILYVCPTQTYCHESVLPLCPASPWVLLRNEHLFSFMTSLHTQLIQLPTNTSVEHHHAWNNNPCLQCRGLEMGDSASSISHNGITGSVCRQTVWKQIALRDFL